MWALPITVEMAVSQGLSKILVFFFRRFGSIKAIQGVEDSSISTVISDILHFAKNFGFLVFCSELFHISRRMNGGLHLHIRLLDRQWLEPIPLDGFRWWVFFFFFLVLMHVVFLQNKKNAGLV